MTIMENENSIAPKRYIETGGMQANAKMLREIFDTNNIPLKILINLRYIEGGLNPKYTLDDKARRFNSEIGRLAINFKMSLINRTEKELN